MSMEICHDHAAVVIYEYGRGGTTCPLCSAVEELEGAKVKIQELEEALSDETKRADTLEQQRDKYHESE